MGSHFNPTALSPPITPEDEPDLAVLLSSIRALASQYELFAKQLAGIDCALVTGKLSTEAAREWLQELGFWEVMPMLCILDRELDA